MKLHTRFRGRRATGSRGLRFVTIGAVGFALQITMLQLLIAWAHWWWLSATLVSVEAAVLHNFFWHVRWTWRDRPGQVAVRLARFQISNGLVSIAGNAVLMALFAGALHWPPAVANTAAIAAMAFTNYVMADRWVFRVGRSAAVAMLTFVALTRPETAAAQGRETLAEWNRFVATVETRLQQTRTARRTATPGDRIDSAGETLRIPGGTITDWRGSVFISGVTLAQLLDGLQHPGTPPPQEEVAAAHVIARSEDSLRLCIRLVRHAIVTVTYDTEHEMRFERRAPQLATATSIATRIDEVGGSDHGFLWRLNSYWRYEETSGGVAVEVESLTLSRDLPLWIRPIAGPIVTRIAGESIVGTLQALQRAFVGGGDGRHASDDQMTVFSAHRFERGLNHDGGDEGVCEQVTLGSSADADRGLAGQPRGQFEFS
jgi:putative flippase GtrA